MILPLMTNLAHLPSKHVTVHQAHERSCELQEHAIMWPFCTKSCVIVCNYGRYKRVSHFDMFFLLSSAGSLTSFCVLRDGRVKDFKFESLAGIIATMSILVLADRFEWQI